MLFNILKQLWSALPRRKPASAGTQDGAPPTADAEAALRQHLETHPADADAWFQLGTLLEQTARDPEALRSFERALALDAGHLWANVGAAAIHEKNGALDRALELYRRALPAAGKHAAQVHARIGGLLRRRGDLHEAMASYRAALEARNDIAEIHYNFALALHESGNIDDAERALRRAVELRPDFAAAHSSLLYICGLNKQWPRERIFEEHRHWAERHADPLTRAATPHDNSRDKERRLNIGYVSADFREHSVSYFIEPIFTGHDRARFRIFCYDNFAGSDAVNQRLRSEVDVWRKIGGLDDEAAAALIRTDEIDILVDLSGHTNGNRLGVFARKPAPVQATWFGYMCTTGMAAIDYRITDSNLDPPGATERYYSETLVRLPCAVAFGPVPDSPPVNALPALSSGSIVFGSFNNYAKISDEVVAVWAHILASLPTAKLLLVAQGGDEPAMRDAVVARFAKYGAGPQQLSVIGRQPLAAFLRLFQAVDIGLDPFPYSGGTTSLHTLWMGVPIVALEGDSEIARSTSGMLLAMGLENLIAKTQAEYHDIAVTLAADRARLAELRAGLRQRMAGSCLCNALEVTRSLEAAYRDIWHRWCTQ